VRPQGNPFKYVSITFAMCFHPSASNNSTISGPISTKFGIRKKLVPVGCDVLSLSTSFRSGGKHLPRDYIVGDRNLQ
jgi:hypothetical protein